VSLPIGGVILASKSAARAQILRGAGVAFETASSGVDEDTIKAEQLAAGATPSKIAEVLAQAKAVGVSAGADALVIGADQTLELDGRLFDKAASLEEGRRQLTELRGRRHQLHSAVVIAQGGAVVWSDVQTARLTMRDFSDAFLEGYMARNAEAILTCVGGYQLEGEGVQLFEAIDGDYFTVLGLPILGLLAELRRRGAAPA
jgi:septum formation protein